MDNQHLPPGFVESSLLWIKLNAPVFYGSCAAFGLATLITLKDGKSWKDALYAGVICLIISLGVINSLELLGINPENALLVGVVIGGMGVERCLKILSIFASAKTNTPVEDKKDEHQR